MALVNVREMMKKAEQEHYAVGHFNINNLEWTKCILQVAEETNSPNTNFLFASNASLPGRIGMTINGENQKTCINTVSSFFNKYYTCSNCEEFEANPKKWNFEQVQKPQVGDIAIQHRPTGRAYHAVIITKIENGKYYVSHADSTKYIKNVELKNKARLTFYRFTANKK